MSQALNLLETEGRARKYWNVDGLPELVMGALWILWGASWLFGETLPQGRVANAYWMFAPLLLVFSSLAAVWAIKKLKARITFPRAGYVDWNPPTRSRHLSAAAAALAVAALIVVLATTNRTGGVERMAAPLVGTILCVAFIVASVVQKAPYLLILAAAALVFGFALDTLISGWDSLNWMLVALGATTSILGGVRLWWFVRTHPRGNPS